MFFKRRYLVCFIVLLVVATLGLFSFLRAFRADVCRGTPIDAMPSPDGRWVAEKRNCGGDEYDDFRLFVRQTGNGDVPNLQESLSLSRVDSVGYVWADSQRLLIAAPRTDDVVERRAQIGKIVANYALYPTTDPERTYVPSAFIAVQKEIQASYRFEADNGIGLPGVGCTLYAEANATPELKKVKLRISANKVFQGKAWDAGHLIDTPQHVGSGILFSSESDYTVPIAFVTAAALDDVEVEKTGLATDSWERHRKPWPVPAGGFGPTWQIMWRMSEPALQRALDKLRSGRFEIRLGYWFDNKELIYVNSSPGEIKPIDEFANCARSGAIYPNLR
jgi:hypothetical protein